VDHLPPGRCPTPAAAPRPARLPDLQGRTDRRSLPDGPGPEFQRGQDAGPGTGDADRGKGPSPVPAPAAPGPASPATTANDLDGIAGSATEIGRGRSAAAPSDPARGRP